jgi:pimeloyl-ACP methyl ester carboxylesterase
MDTRVQLFSTSKSLLVREIDFMVRRELLKSLAMAGGAVVGGVLGARTVAASARGAAGSLPNTSSSHSPYISARDGTPLFYKDWGHGKPVLFVSAWATNSDMWQYQMTPMSEAGLRCIAYDRRGHGRSAQPSDGYDYDTLADDLAAVVAQLDLHQITLVSHSMGGGEVVRYLSRHGAKRANRIVLVSPTTPFLLKTADNPEGVSREVFDKTRAQWRQDWPKWLAENGRASFNAETSQAMVDWFVQMMTQTSLKVALDCNQAIIETDFRAELPKVSVPTLIIHGDKDAFVPLELTGRRTAALIPGAKLIVYEGASHGLMFTQMERLNHDLRSFIAD